MSATIADENLRKLLCNTTSIESIYNSNHTVKMVRPSYSELLSERLEINKNEDKAQVERNKILRYYFVGDFDVTPFANFLPVSVVPEVISQIRSETKQSSIFLLLKCNPELSNVANRG
jgi:hypothetical protein